MDWQHGEYSRQISFNFILPYDFLLLCRILNLTPGTVLTDFLKNLSAFGLDPNHSTARMKLREYFIDYSSAHVSCGSDVIRNLFYELDLIASMNPPSSNDSLLNLYEKWRDAYLMYWFDKWNTTINASKT